MCGITGKSSSCSEVMQPMQACLALIRAEGISAALPRAACNQLRSAAPCIPQMACQPCCRLQLLSSVEPASRISATVCSFLSATQDHANPDSLQQPCQLQLPTSSDHETWHASQAPSILDTGLCTAPLAPSHVFMLTCPAQWPCQLSELWQTVRCNHTRTTSHAAAVHLSCVR